jgi:transcriptional regulator with XRE-family HTH domain
MIFRLAHYRKLHEYTQSQVADAINISQGLYNQLESGKRRMNETYIDALAQLYKIHPTQRIIDPDRDDPLFRQLDEAYRLLTPAERIIVVNSARGIVAGHLSD